MINQPDIRAEFDLLPEMRTESPSQHDDEKKPSARLQKRPMPAGLTDGAVRAKARERKEAVRDAQAIDLSDFTGNQRDKIRRWLAEMPQTYRNRYLEAMAGRSPTVAIASHCFMCMGWEDAAEGVRTCTDPACPLFSYRPGG